MAIKELRKISDIEAALGADSKYLLGHKCTTISKKDLYLPGPDYVDEVFVQNDRSPAVIRNLQTILDHGRLGGTGYISILPVDQGVEHSAGASFAVNPIYFDPENIVKLAMEGGCNAVASTVGALASVSRKYAHKIPFIVKVNHNELLSYPNTFDQILFGNVDQAFQMGAVGIGATVYFGSGGKLSSDPGNIGGLQPRPFPGTCDHTLGLPEKPGFQAGRGRLPRFG